ncbi:ATP-binding cassette domain-containing protein [Phytoactinopolyspora mesophila]|uniref:ATP-binding cassette domain-containing protein n=1 Tax=Phytoactinopolyspora mesophila TaxID=2650750 RepID=A0A7K3M0N6_9ACTN|nr:ATP-binding cassette domain-containing protein [Phytoactinopolyspora mesophila]NDL56839.1 ATP-binding cassette domain-containing protein [Phytoactinopolyspora mesophila]
MSERSVAEPAAAEAKGRQPAARATNLSKWYGPVRALADVNFEIHPGEVVTLVGDNGAGKSTFVKMLSGAIEPTSGEIHIDGEPVHFASPADARERGIETVYQDLALVGHIDVGGNLFLGREPTRGGLLGRLFGVLDLPAMSKQAETSLKELKVTVPSVTAPVGTMSGGQRQATAIARTAMWGNKLLILDEPTAALGVKESEETLKLIEDVAAKKIPLIVVSHNIEHVFRIATRIVVFRQGQLVADLKRNETTPDEVVGYITGARAA